MLRDDVGGGSWRGSPRGRREALPALLLQEAPSTSELTVGHAAILRSCGGYRKMGGGRCRARRQLAPDPPRARPRACSMSLSARDWLRAGSCSDLAGAVGRVRRSLAITRTRSFDRHLGNRARAACAAGPRLSTLRDLSPQILGHIRHRVPALPCLPTTVIWVAST